MKFWKNLCKSKQSKKCLKSVLQDPLLTAKLGFFSYFVEMFKPFLILYQTDQPMLLYLYDDLPQSNLPSLLNQIMKIDTATLIKKLIKRAISRRLIWSNFLKKLNYLLWQPYWNLLRRYLFFLSGFSFTNIHKLHECRGSGRAFL